MSRAWSKAKKKNPSRTAGFTLPDVIHGGAVQIDLVDALVQAVRPVDVRHLAVQTAQLRVGQLRTQDLVVELLWGNAGAALVSGGSARARGPAASYPRRGRTEGRARRPPA